MARSKRVRAVALTQTSKKTKDQKAHIIQDVRDAVDKYKDLYLFSYENMRSNKFKTIRMDFRENKDGESAGGSRIILGKNKLLQIALGRTTEDEYGDNLREVSKLISGSVGLLLTDRPRDEVVQYFEKDTVERDFARAGSISPERVVITSEMVATHPVSMVEQFRKLRLPVEVQNGKVGFVSGDNTEHVVCKEGQALSAEACKLLVHFGVKLADFRISLVCNWSNGAFESLE